MPISTSVPITGRERAQDKLPLRICRLIILRRNDSEVLLLEQDGFHGIPTVSIPQWQRTAPNIVSAVQRKFGLDATCRFSFDHGERYVVLDPIEVAPTIHTKEMSWVRIDEIRWTSDCSETELNGFSTALQQAVTYRDAAPMMAFSKPRWFLEVESWVASSLNDYGMTLSGSWLQYNMGPYFSLLQFSTNGRPVWFKAVGNPNLREYPITLALTKLQSRNLPELVATEPNWNAWLMFEAPGKPLDETSDLESWKSAVGSLAELQAESKNATDNLLKAGCDDLRSASLKGHIERFFEVVHQLMGLQLVTSPRVLNREDLHLVSLELHRAIDELGSLGITDTVGHSDLNSGNVLVGKDSAVFIDWMEGHIGHPFVTFQYLMELFQRLRPGYDSWQQELRHAYSGKWANRYSEEQMTRAFRLMPLIAPFAFAISLKVCDREVTAIGSAHQKLIRSLARKMFLASKRLRGQTFIQFRSSSPAGSVSQSERR